MISPSDFLQTTQFSISSLFTKYLIKIQKMRIRRSAFKLSSSISSHSLSSASPTSFSSPPTTPCSTSPSSLASSSLNSPPSIDNKTRCEGLDLLVKAVLHVAGSVIPDISFEQTNAISKGKRTFRYRKTTVDEAQKGKDENEIGKKKKGVGIELLSKTRRQKRLPAFPSKYQDSVIQPWKRQTRRRRSIAIDG